MSSFQPVAEAGSCTTRRFVSASSFAISSACGSVWKGGFDKSGIGHRRISLPLEDAIHLPSGETASENDRTGVTEKDVRRGLADAPHAHHTLLVAGHEHVGSGAEGGHRGVAGDPEVSLPARHQIDQDCVHHK